MSAFTKADARVRVQRFWLFVLAVVVLPVMGFTGIAIGPWVAFPIVPAQIAALIAWSRWWSVRRGSLRADEQGLWVGDERLVARARVRHADVLQREGRTFVRIVGRWGSLEVDADGEDEASALVEAMRLDPSRSVARFVMQHGTYRSSMISLGLTLAAGLVVPLAMLMAWQVGLGVLALWYATLLYVTLHRITRVAVGADGVWLRRYPFGARFVAFGAIASVATDGAEVTITMRDGEVVRLHHPQGKKGVRLVTSQERAEEARRLVERIESRLEAHRRGAIDVTALARGDRSATDWMREVSKATDEHASFRANAIPPDTLWRVVEDPAAGTTARAGAALALRRRLDDDGRARLRVLADACAAPKLRVALERAADEDEEALEVALEALRDQ